MRLAHWRGHGGHGPCFFCPGCIDMAAQVRHLNATWVARVNAELLRPAGYACVAHFWFLQDTGSCAALDWPSFTGRAVSGC